MRKMTAGLAAVAISLFGGYAAAAKADNSDHCRGNSTDPACDRDGDGVPDGDDECKNDATNTCHDDEDPGDPGDPGLPVDPQAIIDEVVGQLPAPPEGLPTPPEGLPAPPEGVPAPPEGVPAPPEGLPALPEGLPVDPGALPIPPLP
jgi:hypothetical protein